METRVKTTPLHGWHTGNGANMADFGGYEMPLWYETGVKTEHLSVITAAGLFDTSHMASVLVSGKDALDLLQLCHTRELSVLADGRCVYGALLTDNGHVLDDAIVYRFQADQYMICVNAGMGGAVTDHLARYQAGRKVTLRDLTDQLGKVDIQGKNAARILSTLITSPDTLFRHLPYFSFKGHFDPDGPGSSNATLKDGTAILLSRSGYTGEFGFEIFIRPEKVTALWESILAAGKDLGITACGLGARDSLRAGAVLPLSHQDVGDWKFIHHPWMFALPLTEDGTGFTKSFVGDQALMDPMDTFYTVAFAGDNLKKVGHGSEARVLDETGTDIGQVLTCATDMAVGRYENRILSIASPNLPEGFKARGISCGFVRVDRPLAPGTRLVLQEKKRKIHVTVVTDVRPDRTARLKISNFIDIE